MEKRLPNHINLSLLLILICSSLQHLCSANTTYLILCGSNNSTAVNIDGRDFVADFTSKSVVLPSSTIAIKDPNPSSNPSTLYHTARIFTKPSSYKFNIESTGIHLVRLHFYPFFNQNYNLASAIFDVSALGLTLLKDFGVGNKTPVPKEYMINITEPKLEISFTPSGNPASPMAFVNAIEVFFSSANLIPDSNSVRFVPQTDDTSSKSLLAQGLETVHRINVGGPTITPARDTLRRTWITDDDYLQGNTSEKVGPYNGQIKYTEQLSQEIAPASVYKTARKMKDINLVGAKFNITWKLDAAVGFQYLVRMHFCDIVSEPGKNQLSFNVYINESSAYEDLNPSAITSQTVAEPFYKDFVAGPDHSGVMRVSVGPTPSSSNALLNGLEILKIINNSSKNAGSEHKKISIAVLVGSVAGGVVIISLLVAVSLALLKRRKAAAQKKAKETGDASHVGMNSQSHGSRLMNGESAHRSLQINLGLQISFADIKTATNNFDENSKIGEGGFGKVYKGVLQDGRKAAIKRGGTQGSKQGLAEFQTEIMFLSRIQHRHLVSLVGYCEEGSEMILVYELMEKGALRTHLYGSTLPCLSWEQRLEICIGAAKGLHYLHTGFSPGIIHRDVKSSNILLDEDYSAKVADFGISRLGPALDQTHVSTAVKGSFGYFDPDYFRRHQLTDKSDVYSFGVVLLEVLCALPALDPSRPKENLAEWAKLKHKNGLLEEIVDPRIAGQIDSKGLKKYWEIAESCLADYGADRPKIGDVLWNLQYVLGLHEAALKREANEDGSTTQASGIPLPTIRRVPSASVRISEDEMTATTSSSDRSELPTGQVFSQLMTPRG